MPTSTPSTLSVATTSPLQMLVGPANVLKSNSSNLLLQEFRTYDSPFPAYTGADPKERSDDRRTQGVTTRSLHCRREKKAFDAKLRDLVESVVTAIGNHNKQR